MSNIMFPLCGLRCGFEAVTPLAMAGNMNKESQNVLRKWKVVTQNLCQKVSGREKRILQRTQRSCNVIRCSAGHLYQFDHSIVLCCTNNCILLTLNMLVTFGRDM